MIGGGGGLVVDVRFYSVEIKAGGPLHLGSPHLLTSWRVGPANSYFYFVY
jgi:hypothetical protein